MSLVLNTNISSIVAQNNLTGSQALLSQSLTRLSSGLRINSAADDAAGLAISQQFTTQINGTNQAISNANDAVSEAQTAAGALGTIVNNLQSIRTLAVEAANGSNSASDRVALNNQVQQQIAEITQIAQQTTFNGLNVLNGSSGTTVYQVGANVGNTIAINLTQGVGATQIGQYASGNYVVTGNALATGQLTFQVGNGPVTAVAASVAGTQNQGQTAGSAYAIAQAINSAGVGGLSATATNSVSNAFVTVTGAAANNVYNLAINGVNVYGASGLTLGAGVSLTQTQLEQAVNAISSQTGVTASNDTNGNLLLTASDGSNITVNQTLGTGLGGTGLANSANVTTFGTLSLTSAQTITVGGTAPTTVNAALTGSIAATTSNLATQDVLTVGHANSTIASVDSALATVSAFQSQLGAIQNRFQSAVQNLQSTSQNLTQSRSTIQDANFAQETANLTQAQVLEQAGISVLAQANQQPQLILKLLG
jgi:flagellin